MCGRKRKSFCEHYILKPITKAALDLVIARFNAYNSDHVIDELIQNSYVTTHVPTLKSLNLIKKVNLSRKPVLINGATGTGKSIVAQLIKKACHIADKKFVAINCAQFSETLLESEIFGHRKGAFTGANADKVGLLKKADGGMVFFDEVHSLSLRAQQKLMKAIEEKEFYPVGSDDPVRSDFRVVCATCEDLEALIAQKSFRADFYGRISHLQVQLYPLKDRPGDILPLIEHYQRTHIRKIVITNEAKALLMAQEWPKNTRDIEALVERWNLDGIGIVRPEHIRLNRRPGQLPVWKGDEKTVEKIREIGIKAYIKKLRSEIVAHFLLENENVINRAALDLKVTDFYVSDSLGRTARRKDMRNVVAKDSYGC